MSNDAMPRYRIRYREGESGPEYVSADSFSGVEPTSDTYLFKVEGEIVVAVSKMIVNSVEKVADGAAKETMTNGMDEGLPIRESDKKPWSQEAAMRRAIDEAIMVYYPDLVRHAGGSGPIGFDLGYRRRDAGEGASSDPRSLEFRGKGGKVVTKIVKNYHVPRSDDWKPDNEYFTSDEGESFSLVHDVALPAGRIRAAEAMMETPA